MTSMIVWFGLALVVTFVEISLVTFYLLAVAAGLAGGGVAAYLDCPVSTQLTVAGIVTIIMACLSFVLRKKLKRPIDAKANSLDKGERVAVEAAKINNDGSAKVIYRGAEWLAYSTKGSLTAGIYLIEKIDGTRLVLEDKVADESAINTPSNQQPLESKQHND